MEANSNVSYTLIRTSDRMIAERSIGMKSFVKTIKLFLKSPQIILAYLVLLGVSNVFFSQLYKAFVAEYEKWGDKGTDSLFFLSDMGYLCYGFFVFWVFISY